jgi:hypothetical protein
MKLQSWAKSEERDENVYYISKSENESSLSHVFRIIIPKYSHDLRLTSDNIMNFRKQKYK